MALPCAGSPCWGDSVPLLQSPFLGRKCPSHGGVVCIPSSNMGDFDLLGLKSVVVSNHLVTMECYYFLCQYFRYLQTYSQVFLLSKWFIKLPGPRPVSVVPSCYPCCNRKACHPLDLYKKAVSSSGKDEGTLVSQVIILTD